MPVTCTISPITLRKEIHQIQLSEHVSQMNLYHLYQARLNKRAAAVLTPEAQMQSAMPPQGMPMDPSMQSAMPPQGMPMDSSMQNATPPQAPAQLPAEILQDMQFQQFLQDAMGLQLDPNSGMFIDTGSGQQVPPDMIIQMYDQYLQQMQGAMPPQGMPMDPSMQGAVPPQGVPMDPTAGGMPGVEAATVAPEVMSQLQKMIDSSMQAYTAGIDKKLTALVDKLDVVKSALESFKGESDERSANDKEELRRLQEDISAELTPSNVKQASSQTACGRTFNVFDLL